MEKALRFNFKNIFNANRCEGDYRKAVTKRAMKLLKNEGFKDVKYLGQGAFGDVVRAKSPQSKAKVAVKIITSDKRRSLETSLWPKFKHPNILPLLNWMTVDCFDFFVMPLHPKAMGDMLKQKKFTKQPTAFVTCVRWLQDVLSGLAYLHAKGVCHLDLKCNNVLITKEMTAVLIDFSCVNTTDKPIHRYGLIKKYRPPECWDKCHGEGSDINGIPFDMWSFGMLSLSALTGYWMDSQLELPRIWAKDLLPHLQRALEKKNFRCQAQKTFPAASVEGRQLKDVLNILRGTLRLSPAERPAASALLNHKVFDGQTGIELGVDSTWANEREEYADEKTSQANAESVTEKGKEEEDQEDMFDNFIRERFHGTGILVQQEFPPSPLFEEWVVCENWTANFEECMDEKQSQPKAESITEKNEEKENDVFDNFNFKMLHKTGNSSEEETTPFPPIEESLECENWTRGFLVTSTDRF